MKKGFSLIEILVAMTIFSIVMVSIVGFFVGNSASMVKSEHRSRIAVVSEKTFESFRGFLLQEYSPGNLMFDSLWGTANNGDTLFTNIDSIGGNVFASSVILKEKQFNDNSPYAPGSRLFCVIKTKNKETGKINSINVTYSRHR